MRPLILIALLLVLVWTLLFAHDVSEQPEQVVTAGPPASYNEFYGLPPLPTTTTVRARARTAPTIRSSSVGRAAIASRWPTRCTVPGTLNEGPCIPARRPCAIPTYICNRESDMTLNVWNHGGSGASGKYQFMPSTWGGYGGYAHAADAPEEVQDERALELWRSKNGPCHWSAC